MCSDEAPDVFLAYIVTRPTPLRSDSSMENHMNLVRNSMIGLLAAGAALAIPTAFAQDAATGTQQAATQPAPTAQTQPAEAAPSAPKQVTWADLDSDKDGDLSKTEVATVPALTQVFDQADADKNGKLTADEYKKFAAMTPAPAGGARGG